MVHSARICSMFTWSIVLEEEFLIVLDLQRCSWSTRTLLNITLQYVGRKYAGRTQWFTVVGAPGQYTWCFFPWVGSIICVDTLFNGRCSGGAIEAQWCFPRVGSRLSQVGDRAAAHMLPLLLPS